MAESRPNFGDIQRTADGQLYELTASGWRPITEQQARVRLASPGERFLLGLVTGQSEGTAGAVGSMTGVASMLAPFLGGAAGAVRGGLAASAKRQAAQAQGRLARDFGDVVRGENPGVVRGALGAAADQMQASAQSIPILRSLAQIPAETRGKQVNEAVVRALGGNPEEIMQGGGRINRRQLGELVGRIERQFDEAIDKQATMDLGEKLAEEIQLIKSLPKIEQVVFPETLKGVITGAQFKNFRQKLQQVAVGSDEIKATVARQVVQKLDKIAEEAGVVNKELYAEARRRYRVVYALTKGRAFTGDSVNVPSFRSALERIYGKDFQFQRTEKYPDEIRDLLETIAEAELRGTQIPSSGTAERLLGTAAIGGAAYYATR